MSGSKAVITSPNSGHTFEWNDRIAMKCGEALTPLLRDMPAAERIAAMAYQIGAAAQELEGVPDHECMDLVRADLMAELVREIVAAGFRGLRKVEAELSGRGESGAGSISGIYEACNG